MHCLHCGLLTNLKAEPHPHTKPVSMVQTSAHVCPSAPHGDTYRISGLWLLHTTLQFMWCRPLWAWLGQLVPIYQRALSVTAPAYPHLRNSTGARCWPGRERHHIHTSTGGAKRSSFPRGILRGQARLGAGLARENPGPPGPLLWGVASGIRSLGSVLSSVKQGWSWDPPAGLA